MVDALQALEVQTGEVLDGHVEIDGAYFGGHFRPANHIANRVDRRRREHQTDILDRLVHNAHALKLTGESMRKATACNTTLDLSAQA